MAITITFGIQKGGSGKTTTAGIVAYILSRNRNVLAVDMDSQGNLTEMLTQRDIYDFHKNTVFEALKEQDAAKYIYPIEENLHILPAEDHLATFSRWLYLESKIKAYSKVLDKTLQQVKDSYDYIIIDTPPALSDQTVNALTASDAVVCNFETSKFCYSALERFLETVIHVQDMVNPKLEVAGILNTIIDSRRSDTNALIELVQENYPDLSFNTIIKRRASVGRVSIYGFQDNPELREAIKQYDPFVKELINRVG